MRIVSIGDLVKWTIARQRMTIEQLEAYIADDFSGLAGVACRFQTSLFGLLQRIFPSTRSPLKPCFGSISPSVTQDSSGVMLVV